MTFWCRLSQLWRYSHRWIRNVSSSDLSRKKIFFACAWCTWTFQHFRGDTVNFLYNSWKDSQHWGNPHIFVDAPYRTWQPLKRAVAWDLNITGMVDSLRAKWGLCLCHTEKTSQTFGAISSQLSLPVWCMYLGCYSFWCCLYSVVTMTKKLRF